MLNSGKSVWLVLIRNSGLNYWKVRERLITHLVSCLEIISPTLGAAYLPERSGVASLGKERVY